MATETGLCVKDDHSAVRHAHAVLLEERTRGRSADGAAHHQPDGVRPFPTRPSSPRKTCFRFGARKTMKSGLAGVSSNFES